VTSLKVYEDTIDTYSVVLWVTNIDVSYDLFLWIYMKIKDKMF
jgi:hypothetical protein